MTNSVSLTRAVRIADGLVLIEQPDGSFRRVEGPSDWPRVAA